MWQRVSLLVNHPNSQCFRFFNVLVGHRVCSSFSTRHDDELNVTVVSQKSMSIKDVDVFEQAHAPRNTKFCSHGA